VKEPVTLVRIVLGGLAMTNDEAVVIFTTSDPYVAEVVKGALEAEGIACAIGGERQGGFVGVLPEISLMVSAAQAEQARAIIAKHPRQAGTDAEE
jgi:hypothetical protein